MPGKGKRFVKGDPRINRKGLAKGTRQKITLLRESILDVCLSPASKKDKRTYIEHLAAEHPAAFVRLIAKILPAEVKTEAAVDLTTAMKNMTDDELNRLAHAVGDEGGETLSG